ncbi:hypothetical protein Droror1_Dr00000459 [Drosera rotundifolia]
MGFFYLYDLYRMMDVRSARRVSQRQNGAAFVRHRQPNNGVVCAFWSAGNCTRNPCRFLHPGTDTNMTQSRPNTWNRSTSDDYRRSVRKEKVDLMRTDQEVYQSQKKQRSRIENFDDGQMNNEPRPHKDFVSASGARTTKQALPGICKYWITGNCVHGDKCQHLHSWHRGDGFSLVTHLDGHKKAVTGIALPEESHSLYTGSKDGTVRIWNCHTGVCTTVVDMGSEVGCLISEGLWVFVGLSNAIRAWNTKTHADITLSGPVGQVYSLAVSHGMLLAGVHDGSILAWKCNDETSTFKPAACLKGHSNAVVSLVVGAGQLYSGSMDKTIRRWNLETLQCTHVMNGHDHVVMSLICWDQFLLSGSLDKDLKAWVATEIGGLDVTYTHVEQEGIVSLFGMHDAEAKPILFCSLNDDSVGLYELPSFTERGRIFARKEVRTIQLGPGGLFFTGDGSGYVSVWKFLGEPAAGGAMTATTCSS